MVNLNWFYEEWRDIPGFEGRYQASSFGRIKSLCFEGHPGKEKIISPHKVSSPHNKGVNYYRIRVYQNKVPKRIMVHRLIALTFPETCGKYFEGATVNHLDENPSNNYCYNLRWCTQQENNLWGNHIKNIQASLAKNKK